MDRHACYFTQSCSQLSMDGHTGRQEVGAQPCSKALPQPAATSPCFLFLHQNLQQAQSWLRAASTAGDTIFSLTAAHWHCSLLRLALCMATVQDDSIRSVSLQLHEAEAGQGTAPGPWLPDT